MDDGHGYDDDIAFKPGHGGHLSFTHSLSHNQRDNPTTSGRLQTREEVRKGKRGWCLEAFPPPRKALEGSRSVLIGRGGESPPCVQKRVRHVQVGPATRSHALCLDIRVILPFVSCLTRQLDPTPPPARCPRPLPPSRSPRCPLPQPPPSLLYLPCSPLALAAGRKHIATASASLPHFPSARLVPGGTTRIRYTTTIPASSITRVLFPAPF